MKTTLPAPSVLAIALVFASPLVAAFISAPSPPHAAPVSAAPTHEFRFGIALLEAESGEGGWEKLSEDGVAVIRAVQGAEMRYRVRFPEPGFYFVHMRCHYAVGIKNAKGEVLETHSTNDTHLLVGGARLYGSDLTTRPEGMRCHSATLSWWQLPKGPGGHTPEAIKEKPVQAYIPAAGVYEVLLRYRSPGLVIDKLAFTRDGTNPADTLAETKASK